LFWVQIVSLSLGSLVAELRILRNGSFAIGDDSIRNYISQANFSNLTTLYQSLTNDTNSTLDLLNLYTTVGSSLTAGSCGLPCKLGAIIGGVVGGLILIGVGVLLVRWRKKRLLKQREKCEVFDVLHDVPPQARISAKKLLKKQAEIERHKELSRSPSASPADRREVSQQLTPAVVLGADGAFHAHEPISGGEGGASQDSCRRSRTYLTSKPSRFTRRLTASYDPRESVTTTKMTLSQIQRTGEKRGKSNSSSSSEEGWSIFQSSDALKAKKTAVNKNRLPPTQNGAAQPQPPPPTAAALAPLDITKRLRAREFVANRGSTHSPSHTRRQQESLSSRKSPYASRATSPATSALDTAATSSAVWWGTSKGKNHYNKSPFETPPLTPRRRVGTSAGGTLANPYWDDDGDDVFSPPIAATARVQQEEHQPKQFDFDDVSDGRRTPVTGHARRGKAAVVNVFDVEGFSESGSFAAGHSRPTSGAATPLLVAFEVDDSTASVRNNSVRHLVPEGGGDGSDGPLQSFFVEMGDEREDES
jgi:hypothetical protein